MARDALDLLASLPRGLSEAVLVANGLTAEMLAGLAREGLAATDSEAVRASGKATKVSRFRITDAGRRALEGEQDKPPRATHFRFLCNELLQLSV